MADVPKSMFPLETRQCPQLLLTTPVPEVVMAVMVVIMAVGIVMVKVVAVVTVSWCSGW